MFYGVQSLCKTIGFSPQYLSTTAVLCAKERLPRGFNAPTGYMAYVKEHTDPQQDRKENLRTLGARWKALSKEEKQVSELV